MQKKQFNARPTSQSIPENRKGTRTERGYTVHMLRGNIVALSKLLRCSRRMTKKAQNMVLDGTPAPTQGKILKAVYREMLQVMGDELDGKIYM